MPQDYESIVAADAAQDIKVSMNAAVDANPDAEARIQALAKQYGIPPEAARLDSASVERRAKLDAYDYDAIAAKMPATARTLADPDKAKVVHDDVQGLSGVEQLLYNIGKYEVRGFRAVAAAVPRFNEGMFGVGQAGAEMLSKYLGVNLGGGVRGTYMPLGGVMAGDPFGDAAEFFKSQRKRSNAVAEAWAPKGESSTESGIYSGLTSLGQNLMTLPFAVATGNPNMALGPMVGQVGGQAYGKARDTGASVEGSLGYAARDAVIEYATEKMPMSWLIKDIKAGTGFLKTLGKNALGEVPGEQIATFLQDANEWLTLNPGKTTAEFLAERPDAAYQTLIGTLIGVGGTVSTVKAIDAIASRADRSEQIAQQSAEQAQLLGQLNEMATASKVLARDPGTFEQFVAQAAENGPVQAIYLDAGTLQQSGFAEQLAAISPSVAEQLPEALDTGGTIAIPVEEYAAKIAPTEYAQGLLDHLRVDPEGFSRAEAEEYMASDKAKNLQAEVEKVLGEKQNEATWRESAQEVEDFVFNELQKTGRFSTEVNRVDAILHRAFSSVMAARLGITPKEFFDQHTVRVVAEAGKAEGFDQSGVKVDTPEFRKWFGDSKVVDSDGKPLVVYHGSPDVRGIFAEGFKGFSRGSVFFASDSERVANSYADPKRAWDYQNAEENVIPLYLSIKNPMVVDANGKHWRETEKYVEEAKEKGHDGIIIKNSVDDYNNKVGSKSSTVYAFFEPTQAKSALSGPLTSRVDRKVLAGTGPNRGTFDPNDPNILHQPAYHGSPYRFDKFSLEHMGKGEGAQAYGWGLYFAGNKAVAEFYREALSDSKPAEYRVNGVTQFTGTPNQADPREAVIYAIANGSNPSKLVQQYEAQGVSDDFVSAVEATVAALKDAKVERVDSPAGQLYKVDIPEDDTMLHWDKPLSEQPEKVRTALFDFIESEKIRLNATDEMMPRRYPDGRNLYKGMSAQKGGDEIASKYLNSLGISGIKYLDGSSRSAGEGDYNYVIFDDSAINILQTYYQEQGLNRGSYNPATNVISLLKNADLSTFLHETGHYFLEVQSHVAGKIEHAALLHGYDTLTEGEKQILEDTKTLLNWFGVHTLGEWNALSVPEKRSHHESFARGFELYLFEGKAPSLELQGVFQRFRAFIVSAYKQLLSIMNNDAEKVLDVQISDEVRGVMDRMLASSEEIKLAEQGRSMMPMLEGDNAALLDDLKAYHDLGIDATNEAIQILQTRGLRDMQWLDGARSKVLKKLQKDAAERRAAMVMEARKQIMAQPVYQAWQFLTAKFDEANPNDSGRIDRAALDSLGIPEQIVAHVEKLRMVKRDGIHPDLLAERFGFPSGDDLIRTLAATEKPKEAIAGLTDQLMLERYGDLSSDREIERAADAAIHNSVRAKMLATEYAALARAMQVRESAGKGKNGQNLSRALLPSAAKEFAGNLIAKLKVKNIRPAQYASAEVKAGKAAEKALKADDIAQAAAEKRNQLIQHYATRAAYDAQDEVDKMLRTWRDLVNRSDDKLRKSYDMDLLNAVRAVLGQYGIAERKAQRASEYMEIVSKNDPETFAIVSPLIQFAELNAQDFREMTVESLRALAADIDAVLHLSRRSRQMEVDGDLMDRRDIADQLRARLDEIGVPDTRPGEVSAVTDAEKRMIKFRTAIASARRVESWVSMMDGEGFGPFRRFVWARIKDAATAYRADKAKALRQFRELFDAVAPTMKQQLIAAPELGYTFGKGSGGVGMNELLHAILHTGNDSNKRKLLLGRGWASERADGTLDTMKWDAFIARMIGEGKLTKAHYDFAQGVWDLLESTKPLAQKTHRDVFGKYFDEVTANEFETPFGAYRGGYVPALADPLAVTDAKLRELANTENDNLAFAFPTTSKGFTKSRTEYNRPLLLDLRTLTQHIDKVLLFSHMEMPVRDVRRVVGDVAGTLDRYDPGVLGAMLTPWLNRSAKQQVMTPISEDAGVSRFFATLRARAGMAAMFGNVANAVQQITGFSLAAVKVKPALLLSATADFLKHPRKMAQAVAESSPFMADRMENEIAAMNDEINSIVLDPSLFDRAQNWTMRHAYFLQSAIDNTMAPIIWTAAYNQAMEQKHPHKDAVRLADAAVRETQGSMLPEDVSRWETGSAFVRLFTQFAGYFNMQANLLGTEFAKVVRDLGLRNGAGRGLYVFLFGFMAPAVVAELVTQVFRGGPDDADKDGEYLDDWIAALFGWAPLRTATAMIPLGGQAINAGINMMNSKPYDDRMATSPAVSMVESSFRAVFSSVPKALTGEGSSQKAIRDTATLVSMTVGLPASVAARPLGYLAGMAENKISPTSEIDMARGLIQGSASPESKR